MKDFVIHAGHVVLLE